MQPALDQRHQRASSTDSRLVPPVHRRRGQTGTPKWKSWPQPAIQPRTKPTKITKRLAKIKSKAVHGIRLRIDALWRTWEAARLDSVAGISTWMLHHLDPHMTQLTSANGPFCACTQDDHTTPTQRLEPFNETLKSATA